MIRLQKTMRDWTRSRLLRARAALGAVRVGARLADLGAVGAIGAIYAVFSRAFLYGAIGPDEQYFLSEGFALGKGLVPYRDFQEFKPPLVFVLNMLALKLFGLAGMRYRYFFVLLALVAFVVVAVALLSRGVPRLIVVAVEALMLNTFFDSRFHDVGTINSSETAGLCFFLLGVGVLLFKTERVRAQQWIGGALLALAPLGKEPMAVPTLLAWLALGLLHDVESDDPTSWKRFGKTTISGALSIAGVWLCYLLVTRSLGWYLLELHETLIYSADHNEMYGVFPKLPFFASWAECWRRLEDKYVNPPFLAAFVPYFLAALLLWRRRPVAMAAAVVATFAGALYAVTIGHGFFGHYFIMAMAGSFFVGIFGAVAMGSWMPTLDVRWRRWVTLGLSASLLYTLQPRLARDERQWATFHPGPPPVSPRLLDLVARHSSPQDRIWNVGFPAVYVFSDRRTASRIGFVHDSLLHMYPGRTDAERLAPYRAELDVNMPKLVILSEPPAGREKHMALLVTPFLRDHGYRRITEVPAPEVPVFERPY
jgi:hypothetical protein